MNGINLYLYLLVMAGVTYLIRMLPMTLFRTKIRSRLVLSILYYIPYAVLGTMTIPAIFTSAGNMLSSIFGFAIALILSFRKKSLVTVALAATVAAYLASFLPIG